MDSDEGVYRRRFRLMWMELSVTLVSLIAGLGAILWILYVVDAWFVILLAIVCNLIQLVLFLVTYKGLQELSREATEKQIRLGYMPRNLEPDDYAGCNRVFVRAISSISVLAPFFPWLFVYIMYL